MLNFSVHPDFGSQSTRAGVTPNLNTQIHTVQSFQSSRFPSTSGGVTPKFGMAYIAGMVKPAPSMVLTLPDTSTFWIITMSPMAMPMFP